MAVKWTTATNMPDEVKRLLITPRTLLDIGCGIMPQQLVRPSVHICCEPYHQYVSNLQQKIKNQKDREYVVINASWNQAIEIFPGNSVDSVFLIDVIEHLEKDIAVQLLNNTEPVARKQIVLFTPIGFMPQHHPDGKDAWGLDGADWQEHKSGWTPDDFDDSWSIVAAKEYHYTDNLGRKLESPYGAMWAIKNKPAETDGSSMESCKLSRRQLAHNYLDKFINIITLR